MTAAPAAGPGPQTLPAGPTVLLKRLDALLEGWGTDGGAEPMIMPPLLPVADLSRLDVYENFPHQALVVSTLDLTHHQAGSSYEQFEPEALEPALFGLPSAACFAVYLHHEGRALPDGTTVTVLGRCFRREERYEGLRRLLGFHMREIVALGSSDFTQEHLRRFEERVTALTDALGLAVRKEAATDPFYDRGGQRALLQRLSPVKHEFIVDDLAIASLNVHRNFFGERCRITLEGTDRPVHTSCAAFGLERWLSVLHTRYGSWGAATEAVDKAAAALGGTVRSRGAER